MRNTLMRTYSELILLPTFEERFEYLKLDSKVGESTFGFERYLNQNFYHSYEWKQIRRDVILRDNGCDLGVEGYDIFGPIIVHHMNPVTSNDIVLATKELMNPEFLISTRLETHNALHFGDISILTNRPIERSPGDTCPWR